MPITDGHGPFLRRLLDGQINDFFGASLCGKELAFFDGFANNAVERFDGIGGVNCLSNILGIVKQSIQVMPVGTPGFADLWVLAIPLSSKSL